MQNKSAQDIQNEIALIRLAYRQRQDAFNFRVRPTIKEATPYLLTGSLLAFIVAFIISLFR